MIWCCLRSGQQFLSNCVCDLHENVLVKLNYRGYCGFGPESAGFFGFSEKVLFQITQILFKVLQIIPSIDDILDFLIQLSFKCY